MRTEGRVTLSVAEHSSEWSEARIEEAGEMAEVGVIWCNLVLVPSETCVVCVHVRCLMIIFVVYVYQTHTQEE